MLVKEPAYRKPLNSNQKRILKLIYKFRFISVPLLAEYLGKDKSSVYENLYVLENQQYITKQYDSKTYRLRHKPAIYFLANKGICYLRDSTNVSHAALRNMYKNKAASEALVEHSLVCLQLVTQLRRQYPDVFDIFTKSEMTDDEVILRPLPDLYIKRLQPEQSKDSSSADGASIESAEPHEYYVELLEPSVFSWLIRKRINTHQDRCDEQGWSDYPYVLFIAANDSTERRIQKLLENSFSDFEFWTTTTERLNSGETKIWRQFFKDDDNDAPKLKALN